MHIQAAPSRLKREKERPHEVENEKWRETEEELKRRKRDQISYKKTLYEKFFIKAQNIQKFCKCS